MISPEAREAAEKIFLHYKNDLNNENSLHLIEDVIQALLDKSRATLLSAGEDSFNEMGDERKRQLRREYDEWALRQTSSPLGKEGDEPCASKQHQPTIPSTVDAVSATDASKAAPTFNPESAAASPPPPQPADDGISFSRAKLTIESVSPDAVE